MFTLTIMADQEASYPARHSDEADNSNSQFPDSSEQLPDDYVSV